MTDLTALIARLEAATGPDRQLDAEISALTRIATPAVPDWAYKNFPAWRARPDNRVEVVHADGTGGAHFNPPPFTASIDDALTLMADGQTWSLSKWLSKSGDGPPVYWVDLHGYEELQARHPIAAIALCIAALKARAAQESPQ